MRPTRALNSVILSVVGEGNLFKENEEIDYLRPGPLCSERQKM